MPRGIQKVKGNSVEQSVNEYVAFKPQIEKYNMDVLGMDSWMLLRHMKKDHTNFTYLFYNSYGVVQTYFF